MMFYHHDFEGHCVETKLKFLFLPRKCTLSGKLLWFTMAYRKVALYTGTDHPVKLTRYYDKKEYIIAKLKEKI